MFIFDVVAIDQIRKCDQLLLLKEGLFPSDETLQILTVHHDGFELL